MIHVTAQSMPSGKSREKVTRPMSCSILMDVHFDGARASSRHSIPGTENTCSFVSFELRAAQAWITTDYGRVNRVEPQLVVRSGRELERMAALHRHSPRAVRRYRPPSDLMLQAANDRFGRFIASHHVNVRLLRISLKKPSSIPSDGEACGVSEKGLEGLFGRQLLGRHPGAMRPAFPEAY